MNSPAKPTPWAENDLRPESDSVLSLLLHRRLVTSLTVAGLLSNNYFE